MKIELKPFQDVAVFDILRQLSAARRDAIEFPQAVLLSAPTGAGKTVIATAVIEQLMDGGEDGAIPNPPTVLWLTDQPELNIQTRRKMEQASSSLAERIVTIEPSFREAKLGPGKVYFLNTQKLGRNSNLVSPRDAAPWSLWDVLRDTVIERPADFVLVIDEAHRGMSETRGDREQAQTIVQRFVKGDGDMPPVPIILGISATPERFLSSVTGRRTLRPLIDIPAEEVRISGLLKQTLLVFHPKRRAPSDYTLLRAAAERLGKYHKSWEDYERRAGTGESVSPLLVVQVENSPSGRTTDVTQTDLGLALSVIEGVLGTLDTDQIAHSFQEDSPVPLGDGRVVRYVAPSDIQDASELRVVFFKTALTTGWDCPRAEVMMSFRKSTDHTTIAQLVGRMVRTPLARTIEDDEFLNTVSLYLPHYDRAGLDRVLARLKQDDPEFMPPIDIEPGDDRVSLHRSASLMSCFEVLERIPTYDPRRSRATTSIRRVIKLARLLDRDDITTDALDSVLAETVALLSRRRLALEQSDWWADVVKDAGTIDLRTVEWGIGGVGEVSETTSLIPITQQNVDDLFDSAGRRLGEGIHKAYWRVRAAEDSSPRMIRRIAKLEIFALSQDRDTQQLLEQFADDKIETLLRTYGAAVEALPVDRRDGYDSIRLTARDPQSKPLGSFERIEGWSSGTLWNNHLYVDDNNEFHYEFRRSGWEPLVLANAMAEDGFIGWLRFEERKDWALCVPYRVGADVKPFYPDIATFRRQGDRIVIDLLDPHDPSRDDWMPKVKGLAEYAQKHWTSWGRIEPMFVDGGRIYALDLSVERNRNAALNADGASSLRALFRPAPSQSTAG